MFPFSRRSLTQSIDVEIHRVVRAESPGKYWIFFTSDLCARAGFTLGVVALFLYLLIYSIASRAGAVPGEALAGLAQSFAYVFAVCLSLSIIGSIVREPLFKELQQIARGALPRVFEMLS